MIPSRGRIIQPSGMASHQAREACKRDPEFLFCRTLQEGMASQGETPSTWNTLGYHFKHRSDDPWILERSQGCVGYRCDAPRKGAICVDWGPRGLGGLRWHRRLDKEGAGHGRG